jgi:hypothetical protein
MPDWRILRLDVVLKNALRCGHRPLGFVARTLPYVPAHIPLLALVPTVIDQLYQSPRDDDYLHVQDFLEKHLRFSPFFIMDPVTNEPMKPHDPEMGLPRIEADCLNSQYGVAIDYAVRGAREGQLFEMECIGPHYRSNGLPVKMAGYMFFKSGESGNLKLDEKATLNEIDLTELICRSQWGGERNKGYGRIASVVFTKTETLWGAPLKMENFSEDPVIFWEQNLPCSFLLKYDDALPHHIDGQIVPFSGRLYDPDKGPGRKASLPLVVWDLGWQSRHDLYIRLGCRAAETINLDKIECKCS